MKREEFPEDNEFYLSWGRSAESAVAEGILTPHDVVIAALAIGATFARLAAGSLTGADWIEGHAKEMARLMREESANERH